MNFRFGFVLLVGALCSGTTSAEYEDYLKDGTDSHRAVRNTQDPIDINERHRPVVLPNQRPRPLVLIPENYPQEKLRPRRDLLDAADEETVPRVPRSISQSSFPRTGRKPQPSPTIPRPPRPTRFRREAEDEQNARYVRSLQPQKPGYPYPVPHPSPTFPRPEDIRGPVLARFRRGSRISVDVEKDRGTKPAARVSVEHNVYKSGDGRTRVDAGGYANTRGDRGGMINFSHRF